MKKILLTMGAIVFMFSGLMAQNQEKPKREKISVEDRVEKMAKSLELTDKQKGELTTFFKDMEKNRENEVKKEKATKEEMEAKMKEMQTKLKSILGDEKFEKWQKMRPQKGKDGEQVKDRKKGPAAEMGFAPRFKKMDMQQRPERQKREMPTPKEQADRLTKQLNLTEAQNAELVTYFTDQKTKREAARESAKKEDKTTKEARQAEMKKEREQESAALEKIIGKEKMDELNKFREENRKKFENRKKEDK